MKTFKDVCRNNWYVITATLLFVVSSEVLGGIISYGHIDDSFTSADFCFNILLRFVFLVGGVLLAYFFGGMLNHEYSGAFAFVLIFLTVLNIDTGLFSMSSRDIAYSIFAVLAMLALAFYYENSCCDSLLHTIFYYLMVTALAIASEDKIEFFIVLLAAVFIFAAKRNQIKSKSVRVVNYICAVLVVAAMAYMFVDLLDTHIGLVFFEGTGFHPEAVILSAEPFGKAKYFEEIAKAPYIYELTNIIGHFGSVAGTVMCVIIVMLVASLFVKCFKSSDTSRPADVVVTMIISVKCIAGIFENFAIISGLDVRIPVLADNKYGCLVFGLLLGYMFASRERLDFMKGAYRQMIKSIIKSDEDNSEVSEDV